MKERKKKEGNKKKEEKGAVDATISIRRHPFLALMYPCHSLAWPHHRADHQLLCTLFCVFLLLGPFSCCSVISLVCSSSCSRDLIILTSDKDAELYLFICNCVHCITRAGIASQRNWCLRECLVRFSSPPL